VGDLQIGILSDVYLGGVWVAALDRFARMAAALGEAPLADSARGIRSRALRTLEAKLWMPAQGQYAFALLQDGTVNANLTAWPATAMAFGAFDGVRGAAMAARLASSSIMTDWGARPLDGASALFDPLHYNNGAVWPFVTGFVSLAQYRYHNAPAGRFALEAVARTTFDQSLGRNPEVISGRLYKPLDTAVPQQFFATSMILTPLLRGLLGVDVDVPARRVTVAPHLPADWDSVAAENIPVGRGRISIVVRRERGRMTLAVRRVDGDGRPIDVAFSPALPLGARVTGAGVTSDRTPGDVHATTTAAVMTSGMLGISFSGGWRVVPPAMPPVIGSRSQAPRMLSERLGPAPTGDDRYVLSLEGIAGHTYAFRLLAPDAATAANLVAAASEGASAAVQPAAGPGTEREVRITFPAGGGSADGYSAATVTFSGKRP
jgi:hypothetical protein